MREEKLVCGSCEQEFFVVDGADNESLEFVDGEKIIFRVNCPNSNCQNEIPLVYRLSHVY